MYYIYISYKVLYLIKKAKQLRDRLGPSVKLSNYTTYYN